MKNKLKIIAISTGDPAGVGPEISVKALRFFTRNPDIAYVIYGEIDKVKGLEIVEYNTEKEDSFRDNNKVVRISSAEEITTGGTLYLIEISDESIVKGEPSSSSGYITHSILKRVVADIKKYHFDALLTCPVSKKYVAEFAPEFIGHTEFLAKEFGVNDFVMNFTGLDISIALMTTHCSLNDVSSQLTKDFLLPKIRTVHQFCKKMNFDKIALLSLNPHCGEDGLFGNEEYLLQNIISELKNEDIVIDGPFPSDSFFKYNAKDYKQVIALYHDQGLIPFKMLSQDSGVNMTLGLPFIRTSVDHGTAYSLAGKNLASHSSFTSALSVTEKMLGFTKLENDTYSVLAPYYDRYMQDTKPELWKDFILALYQKYANDFPVKILDMACGTASVSSLLVKKGYEVDAFDISAKMLEFAAKKKYSPSLYRADFDSYLPKSVYNLVISLFDSINYINNKRKLLSLFNRTAGSLKKDGLFIFDIATISNTEANFDNLVNVTEYEESIVIQRAEYDRKKQTQTVTFDIINKLDNNWQRDISSQRIYMTSEIIKLLAKVPELTLLGIHKHGSLKKLPIYDTVDYAAERIFFVLKKR